MGGALIRLHLLYGIVTKFCSFEGKVEGEGQPHPLLHTLLKCDIHKTHISTRLSSYYYSSLIDYHLLYHKQCHLSFIQLDYYCVNIIINHTFIHIQ